MSVLTITKDNFEKEVINSGKTVLLDFWAEWCGPCRMLAPIIHEIGEEEPDITVGKVNVDEEAELSAAYNVMSIPTLMVFKNGEVVTELIGARPKEEILELLK